jgi:CheY-like chemotaxis protein
MTRVVVAHEDDEMRELLLELLTELGHQAVGVASSGDAWHLLHTAESSMVTVLDVGIPRRNALDSLQKLVADPLVAEQHGIILLTSLPLTRTKFLPDNILANLPEHIIELVMPFDLDDLERAVESVAKKCVVEVRR